MTDLGNGLLVALGIGLLIFVHELGHYLAARWIGARVEVFSLGFGPRLLGFRRGPTDYRLSMIPLGGYVAVAGQDPGDDRFDAEQSLSDKTVGQRTLFFLGGVAMNVLFAVIAFPIAFHAGVSFTAPEIGNVDYGSGAWEARLQRGDRVLAIDGKPVHSFDTLQNEVALAGGRNVHILLERDGVQHSIEVRPQFQTDYGFYVIGIDSAVDDAPPTLAVAKDGPAAAAGLRSGDELLQQNGHAVLGAAGLDALIADQNSPVKQRTLLVRSGGTERTVVLQPSAKPSTAPKQVGVLPLARVVSAIRSGLPALAAFDLQHGDRLLGVDGLPFRGPDLATAVAANPERAELELLVRRGERELRLHGPFSKADRQVIGEFVAVTPDMENTVLAPADDGPAFAAGIRPGDRVLRINGRALDDWSDLRTRVLDGADEPIELEVERVEALGAAAVPMKFTVSARARAIDDYGYTPLIPQKRTEVRAEGVGDALRLGTVCAIDLVKQLYVTLKRLLTGDVAAKNLGGIIQISRQSYHYTQWGLPRFLYFLALLSLNLAFINVLPIPVLDGGHLLFLLIEKVKGSPVSVRVLNYSQVFGLVLVLALVVFVTYNDILRLL